MDDLAGHLFGAECIMKTIEPEASLRSVLRALALSGASQLKLYPEPHTKIVCANCVFSGLYEQWVEELGGAAYVAELAPGRKAALDRVAAASKEAFGAPCHENVYLRKGEAFGTLRKVAKEALATFGWTRGRPEPEHLWGHPACVAIVKENRRRERAARLKDRKPDGTVEDFADIPEFDPRRLDLAGFLALLPRMPWFAHLGEPHPRDAWAERIDTWDGWGGPESLMGTCIGVEQSAWQDAIEEAAGHERERVKEGWMPRVGEFRNLAVRGFDLAAEEEKARLTAAGEDEDEGYYDSIGDDPWHGPTNATGCAAWVAITIAVCLELGLPIPTNAPRQWAWLALGHWACGYSPDDLDRRDVGGAASIARLEEAWLVVL
jgi:hypothetical protein